MPGFEVFEEKIDYYDESINDNLEIDLKSHAFEVLDVIVDSYNNNLPPYNEVIMPQVYKPDSLLPDGNYHQKHEHAMYFWNICSYMSGRIKSDVAFKRMTNIFNENPELFDSKILAQTDPSFVSNVLKQNGLGRQNQVANNLIENAKRLVSEYDGDPRNIFKGVKTYEECVQRIKNNKGRGFHGFREKMTSMITYYFIEENLISEINFPVPVDFHVLRVAFATQMISSDEDVFYKSDKISDNLRELISDYMNDRSVDPLVLTNSIWSLSSNLCNKRSGNLSALDKDSLYYSEVWNRSCGRCAVKSYCKYDIPAKPYYNNGRIELLDKGEKSLIRQLSFFDK